MQAVTCGLDNKVSIYNIHKVEQVVKRRLKHAEGLLSVQAEVFDTAGRSSCYP